MSSFGKVLALGMVTFSSVAVAGNYQPSIVGSWVCEENGVPGFLINFGAGGDLIGTAPAPSLSTIHGSWKRTGRETFDSSDIAFLLDGSGNTQFILRSNATSTLTSRDSFVSSIDVFVVDLSGNVVDTSTDEAACTRIPVE